jgi:hypothetical protein
MSANKEAGLQRVDVQGQLPVGFERLSEEEQIALLKKMQEKQVDISADLMKAVGKSKVAENDLRVGMDAIKELDADRKYYTQKIEAETGSGRIDVHVKGGDTKFIVPILITIGVVILAILVLLKF